MERTKGTKIVYSCVYNVCKHFALFTGILPTLFLNVITIFFFLSKHNFI